MKRPSFQSRVFETTCMNIIHWTGFDTEGLLQQYEVSALVVLLETTPKKGI